MALLGETCKATLNGTGVVQCPLRGPHVEVGAEEIEHVLLLGELQPVGGLPKRRELLVLGQFTNARVLGHDLRGEVDDVGTVVPVVGHRLTMRRGHDGSTELVHLHAAIVDVELTCHGGPRRCEHPSKRIPYGGPTRVPQMQRARGIG